MISVLNNLLKHNVTNIAYSKYYRINQARIDLYLQHFNANTEQASKIT